MDTFHRLFGYAMELRRELRESAGAGPASSASAPPPADGTLLQEIKKLQQGGRAVHVPKVAVASFVEEAAPAKKSRTPW
eukprot:8067241-Pyramimonas_sp.AAC.1